MKKLTIIIVVLSLILIVGAFVYFVSGVSGTFPPIKKYKCSANVEQLITGLKKYASNNPDMSVNITDTVGSPANGYAVYLDLKLIKDSQQLEYNLMCENKESMKSEVALIFAFNATTLSGGYGKNATGIGVLIKYFDANFLVGFKKSQNINLTPIKPTFLDPLKHAWNGD